MAIAIPIAALLLIAYAIAYLIDEPLRRYTEAKVNRALKGYTARIGKLDFHPIGFSLDLNDVIVTQDAYPDPPVIQLDRLSASVHWRALLTGKVVGDIELVKPTLYVNLPQARKEMNDPTPVKDRGWQDALQAIYPLEINHFEIQHGDVTYVDQGPFKPLHVREINVVATGIRNRPDPEERPYPSAVQFSALAFDSGRVSAEGNANFLAEPNPTFRGDVELASIELDYFKPITNRYNLWVDKGMLSATGKVESGQELKEVTLAHAAVDGIQVDFLHTAPTAGAEKQTRQEVKETAKESSNKPGVNLRIKELQITRSTFGYVNKATSPAYRVFLTVAEGALTNLSNQEIEGSAGARLKGAFMGDGDATAEATFRAEKSGPAFNVGIRIENVDATKMNDLFRAYGRFDAASGQFFLYSEMAAKDGVITGYVKPLFKDLRVYAKEQDKSKSITRKAYERVVGGVAKILKNRQREEVATKATVLGRIDNPKVPIVDVVVKLVQNAFFKEILPGFDRAAGGGDDTEP